MGAYLLPDSRPIRRTGAIELRGVWYVPVYCANCGKRYGMVPEHHITHVFALCDQGCAGKYGDGAHHYVDPDAIYRERATEEVFLKHGRPLTAAEVTRAVENNSALRALARDWEARLRSAA